LGIEKGFDERRGRPASVYAEEENGMASVVDKVQFTGLEIHDHWSPDEDIPRIRHLGCRRSREFEANSKLGSGRLDVR